MAQVLGPIAEPYPPEVAEVLARYPQQGGYLLTLFRTFAASPRFLRKGVANLLDKESPLPLRLREIVILRVTANTDCEYEWGVHVAAFAGAAKLTPEQVAATRLGDDAAPCWAPQEALLIRAVDELCRKGGIQPNTYAQFAESWTVAEQLEIIALAGNYHTISFVANTAALPPELFAARFPKPA
jgi:alkylhydroperoxidase family enzyme